MNHYRLTHHRHRPLVFWLFLVNIVVALIWGPVLMSLTVAGPLKHLGGSVLWVVLISYYANMMSGFASASALYSSLVAHKVAERVGAHEPMGQTTSHEGGVW
jgi:hypothetical protein